jgi:two-component system, chemotaxis family, chemotaxis protein CheY
MQKKILVVDDFASVRNFVCSTLERKGYSTVGAANGKDAYRILTEGPVNFDLVLTDYNMPGSTGFDLLKLIKANPLTSNIPVMFLTTDLSYQKMESAFKAGLFGWIKKPYRSEDFFEKIEKATGSINNSLTIASNN